MFNGNYSDWLEEGMVSPHLSSDGKCITTCPRTGSAEVSSQYFQGDVIATNPDKTAAMYENGDGNLCVDDFSSGESWMVVPEEHPVTDFAELMDIAFNLGIRYTDRQLSQYLFGLVCQPTRGFYMESAKRKRVFEEAGKDSKIHVGIFHDDANEMVILDNEDLEDKMDYTDSCEKDPNNTYVVWCDDESVSIYPYSEYKKYIDTAAKIAEEQLKEATEDDPYIEVYDIPYISVCADGAEDYERVEKFIEDPEAYVREAVNESFTDMDSSSGGAIFTLSEDGRIKEIANGDLSLYWGFDNEDSDDE